MRPSHRRCGRPGWADRVSGRYLLLPSSARFRCHRRSAAHPQRRASKGPKLDERSKTRREIEIPLADGEQAHTSYDQLLGALSFQPVAQVSKVRQHFHLLRDGQSIELSVDQVQGVGDFIELEIVVADESEIAAARQLIDDLAGELRLATGERRSYLELLLGE